VSNSIQTEFYSTRREAELTSLCDLSARVGSDPLLVQASNGNTSIKLNGALWIKASGKWLARATEEDMFVALELAEVKESIRNDREITAHNSTTRFRPPSIETPMHAVLPHRVVVHVHSINAIAWAIRLDGPDQLRERLSGLQWRWIPYAASGIPLAREIEKAVDDSPEMDVFILGNHGLVVCGADCQTAQELLVEVEERIAICPRRPPEADATMLKMIARIAGWQFPNVDTLHALGTDPVTRTILGGGVLYPCQAIFLGRTMPLFPPAVVASKFKRCLDGKGRIPEFVAVERGGVMLSDKMSDAARATLIGLAEVTQRTAESAQLRYLQDWEVENILSNGAESYKGIVELSTAKESRPETLMLRQAEARS
jgi:rhamnose utilization protein RhaD (predicted bifunctional aldolase and dehydrogenase)